MRVKVGVLASLSILSGLLLLLENYDILVGVTKFWPIFPAILGVGLVLLFFRQHKADLKLLGIGVYLVGASILLFVCSFTSWSMMAKAWPMFIGIMGLSILVLVPFVEMRVLFLAGAFFLISLCLVLFLILAVDPKLWPISLVLAGITVLIFMRAR